VTGQRIERLYAFVALEADGGEGVAAGTVPGTRLVMPLVGADEARMRAERPRAQAIATELGVPLLLCRFDRRTDLERVDP
jgi:hypothetical protein